MSVHYEPCKKHPNDLENSCGITGCALGHLNKYQCKNFQDHVKFFYGHPDLDNTLLNELEKEYIRRGPPND